MRKPARYLAAGLLCLGCLLTCFTGSASASAPPITQESLRAIEETLYLGDPTAAIQRAEHLRETALPSQLPDVLSLLGRLHDAVAEYDVAAAYHAHALGNATILHGEESLALIPHLSAMGSHHIMALRMDEAIDSFERARSLVASTLGERALNTQAFHDILAAIALVQKDGNALEAAAGNATISLEIVSEHLWEDHPARIKALARLGQVQLRQERYEEAAATLAEAVALGRKALGAEHPDVLTTTLQLAGALAGQGKLDDGLELANATMLIFHSMPDYPYSLAWPRGILQADVWPVVAALAKAGRWEDALALQEVRVALWEQEPGYFRNLAGHLEDAYRRDWLAFRAHGPGDYVSPGFLMPLAIQFDQLFRLQSEAHTQQFLEDFDRYMALHIAQVLQVARETQGRVNVLPPMLRPSLQEIQHWRHMMYASGPETLMVARITARAALNRSFGPPQGISVAQLRDARKTNMHALDAFLERMEQKHPDGSTNPFLYFFDRIKNHLPAVAFYTIPEAIDLLDATPSANRPMRLVALVHNPPLDEEDGADAQTGNDDPNAYFEGMVELGPCPATPETIDLSPLLAVAPANATPTVLPGNVSEPMRRVLVERLGWRLFEPPAP